ncbi:MAG: hypothetical protein IKQ40_01905, partial [Lachnospiraceae bacterium]|nr:hypothetical protein [Lachnospiraceae bacterium]
MDKVKKIMASRTCFALMSNLISAAVALCLFRPFWEESDDVGMALLAEGAYGYSEAHLLYSNVVYGKVLCALQGLIPSARWHALLMILFAFAALTAFVFVLAKDLKGKILSVIFLASIDYELYTALQFSKLSAVTAICACLILFECARGDLDKKCRRVLRIIATACAGAAFAVRLESFLLAVLIAGCYGICCVISECARGEFIPKIRPYIISFVPMFVIAGLLFSADVYSYSSGGWKDYKDYYNSVTQMTDYHYNALLYDLHGDELSALGVSENDATMYITYESLEEDFTSTELMDSISALDVKGIKYVNADFMKAWIANLYEEMMTLNGVMTGLVFILALIAAYIGKSGDRRFYMLNLTVQAAVTLAVLFYYQYSSRYCHRVVYALLLAELAFFVYMLHDMDVYDISRPVRMCVFFALAFCLISSRLGNEFAYREYERSSYSYDELISYMEQNKDTLFISDVFTMIDNGKYDI